MENTQFTQAGVYDQPEEKVQIVEHVVEVQKPVVVELTSKKYKRLILHAHFLSFLSVLLFFFTFSDTARKIMSIETGVILSICLFGVSIIVYQLGKFLAWWNNG